MSSVVHQVHIAAPIEAVWKEVTKRDEVQRPFFDTQMDSRLEPGSHLAMRSGNGKMTSVVGEVLEVEPMRKLSFTFKFTMHDDPPCRVTYELEEKDGGTLFTMTSDKLPEGTKMYAFFSLMSPFLPKQTRSDRWSPERCLEAASRERLTA